MKYTKVSYETIKYIQRDADFICCQNCHWIA